MCGIAGEFRYGGAPANPRIVAAMTDAMIPRGPDSGGSFSQDSVAFGHRRLKIMDTSDSSNQPMIDSALGMTIVFNGAIYNYRELRQELEAKGYRFFSRGDTEVILKAYHAWGKGCTERFNGMFAFVIWERDSNRIFGARDRLGIKPFYYSETPQAFRFASSLPAMLVAKDLDRDIDPQALHHYMTFHAVVPAPFTILKGVRKLPPATRFTIEADGTRREEVYWSLTMSQEGADATRSEDEWKEILLEKLRQAVRRRTVADVPVGVLLSGGLDSSLIVGLLADQGKTPYETFSIGFEAAGGEDGDEFKYSDLIAEHFDTKHHKIAIPNDGILEHLPDCISAMSEPMVSHDNVAFYLLSREVAKHVKVVLSGQGADEVFAGYHWYPPLLESNDPASDYAKVFFDSDHGEFGEAIQEHYVNGDYSSAFISQQFAAAGAERPVDKALRLDTTVMLVDDPVKRVDNMTMASALEARVPFLDHELVELAGRIPAELKVKQEGKHILKEAARSVIPHEVIDRPKGYFPVPALKYIQGPFLEMIVEVMDRKVAKERGLFNQSYLDKLYAAPEKHITPLRGSKLYQIALLEMWLQTHVA